MATKQEKADQAAKDAMYEDVVCPADEQHLRTAIPGKPKIVKRLAKIFRVSICCRHWERSGARLGCKCQHVHCPCR